MNGVEKRHHELEMWRSELQDELTHLRQVEEQLREEIELINLRLNFIERGPAHVRQVFALELRGELEEKTAEFVQWQELYHDRLQALDTLIQMLSVVV